ncbi:unnamed protein product [Periconia digitata]|uniref:Uncharacterized protein n=1 Tax=Periconia digitata TaxID=1303443 RepID=A0A9W4UGB5_9PLEO|nr:unnamed protein product [Periconia digitata]
MEVASALCPKRHGQYCRSSFEFDAPAGADGTASGPTYLSSLFGDVFEARHHYTVGSDGSNSRRCSTRGDLRADAIVAEIAYFLELMERDEYPYKSHSRKINPTLNEAVNQLITSCNTMASTATSACLPPDHVIRLIAVQLLASCYTLLPATSSHSFPLIRQRKTPRVITALRLHTYFRYSPAAGYHARDPSETTPWPGLYRGSFIGEEVFDTTTGYTKQDSANQKTDLKHEYHTGAWNDGSAEERQGRNRSLPSSPTSRAGKELGLNWRLICQTLALRGPNRKARPSKQHPVKNHKKLFFFNRSGGRTRKPTDEIHTTNTPPARPKPGPIRMPSVDDAYRIPSKHRLRRTHSAPRTPAFDEPLDVSPLYSQRNSSTPTLGSFMPYHFEVPEIRRISASTTAGSLRSVIMTRRPDLLHVEGYFPKLPSKSFDSTRLYPFEEVPSVSRPATPIGGLSPMALYTVIPEASGLQNDYFSLPSLPSPGDGGAVYEADGHDLFQFTVKDTDTSSEESVLNEQKRRHSELLSGSDSADSIVRKRSDEDSQKSRCSRSK